MKLDRGDVIAKLGGAAAVAAIEQAYRTARQHKWYYESRMVTVNDLYALEKGVNPTLDQFTDIIGRHCKQPREGLGYDNSPVTHMWRSMSMPDHPL